MHTHMYNYMYTQTHTQRETVDEHEAMSRYSSQYEAKLNPFAAFGAKASC